MSKHEKLFSLEQLSRQQINLPSNDIVNVQSISTNSHELDSLTTRKKSDNDKQIAHEQCHIKALDYKPYNNLLSESAASARKLDLSENNFALRY